MGPRTGKGPSLRWRKTARERRARVSVMTPHIAAIPELLDRGYGKPTQHVAGDDDAATVKSLIEVSFVHPTADADRL